MLRCAAVTASRPVLTARVGLLSVNASRRCISFTSRKYAPQELTTPVKGSEGHHIQDAPRSETKPQNDVPTGDWVLFHPAYSDAEMKAVKVVRHERRTLSDKVASMFVYTLRKGFDIVSLYRHKEIPANSTMSLQELRTGGYSMDPHAWLNRILFLESIAGVPGMVAATCRHLRSLRLMRRDAGWIHTLLEEAENERMHLMTFMTLRNPGIFFRALILGAQGVFYNLFFFSYLLSPRTCHRFVGILEEEAVYTYTKCIEDIEQGRLPEWADKPAPEIAIDYWRLNPNATLLDVIYAVRSDESTHRFVNHTLANIDGKKDVNPFAIREPDMFVKGEKPGFSRAEAEQYVEKSHVLLSQQPEPPSQPPKVSDMLVPKGH
ncbi:mitochondrial alternative oxidase [Exidia glandulosa HHB12029]|uniref:Alternative oxidase n=1 Tax=Exidia glandulosa HHB12029 TaxID=1314781 RepID=A0A165QB11_EXIGL|nr:mitochondrial alternative oxidase [Exidia glandulosa HHB12029]